MYLPSESLEPLTASQKPAWGVPGVSPQAFFFLHLGLSRFQSFDSLYQLNISILEYEALP